MAMSLLDLLDSKHTDPPSPHFLQFPLPASRQHPSGQLGQKTQARPQLIPILRHPKAGASRACWSYVSRRWHTFVEAHADQCDGNYSQVDVQEIETYFLGQPGRRVGRGHVISNVTSMLTRTLRHFQLNPLPFLIQTRERVITSNIYISLDCQRMSYLIPPWRTLLKCLPPSHHLICSIKSFPLI